MTQDVYARKIMSFLEKNPNATAKAIADATKIPFIQVWTVANKLQKSGKLEVSNKQYSLVVVKKAAERPKSEGEPKEGRNFGRDFSQIRFRGEVYRKGKFILALAQAFVESRPKITEKELSAMFPENLVRTHGLFTKLEHAREINLAGKQRYFARREQIITLGCGTEVCVTNQISKQNFPGIVEAFKKAGVITEVEYV